MQCKVVMPIEAHVDPSPACPWRAPQHVVLPSQFEGLTQASQVALPPARGVETIMRVGCLAHSSTLARAT
eukprot:8686234-Heterocapsa_arctica.AAC.1